MAAVSFIPMIEVAWCDGSVAPDERDVVLNTAGAQGIHPSSATFEILKHWLDERPDPRIIEAWKEYVKEMARLMPKESLAAMKKLMLDRCAASLSRGWWISGPGNGFQARASQD